MSALDSLICKAREHYNAKEYREARGICEAILRDNPRHDEGLLISGACAGAMGHASAAVSLMQAAVRLGSGDAQIWRRLGGALCDVDAQEAMDSYGRAMRLDPDNVDLLLERAGAAYRLLDPGTAWPVIQESVSSAPDCAPLNLLAAKTLHDLRRLEEAEPYFAKALAERPDDPICRWEYAMQLLLRGRFEKGWEYYDARFKAHGWRLTRYPFSMPEWNGQPLGGKTLLVHAEQGLGDEIMFYSITPELIEEAGRVIIACSPTLAGLVQHSFPRAIVKAFPRDSRSVEAWKQGAPPPPWTAELAPIHYQCSAGSLPRWRRSRMDDFIDRPAYLRADPKLAAQFERLLRERIDGFEGIFKVGLAWTGNLATGAMGQAKSIPIEQLAPLAETRGVRFVGLHTPEHARTAGRVPALRIVDLAGHLKTLGHTAALMANLDLVISVDTATCHLAGGLGLETWVPLRVRADWRYLDTGSRCIWYPAMRLFRQEAEGDWASVIEAMCWSLVGRVPA